MSENLRLALQITLVGMSLVFAAIVLLWGLMAALVRVTAEPPPADSGKIGVGALAQPDDRELKRRAAVAAVAVASAHSQQRPALPLPPTANVSPWQAVMRANHLKQRGPVR